MFADELMYWASTESPAVKMASLNDTDHTTLLTESKADYTGITLYNNSLYISDSSRRSAFTLFQLFTIYCIIYIKLAPLIEYLRARVGYVEFLDKITFLHHLIAFKELYRTEIRFFEI